MTEGAKNCCIFNSRNSSARFVSSQGVMDFVRQFSCEKLNYMMGVYWSEVGVLLTGNILVSTHSHAELDNLGYETLETGEPLRRRRMRDLCPPLWCVSAGARGCNSESMLELAEDGGNEGKDELISNFIGRMLALSGVVTLFVVRFCWSFFEYLCALV